MQKWFKQSVAEVLAALHTNSASGLTEAEVVKRRTEVGANCLQAVKKRGAWQLFGAQFLDFMVLVLLGAAAVSGFLGEKADALTIVAIVILNAILGFVQEYRAERSLAALKELTAPQARVIRERQIRVIAAKDLVPGDILVIESGDRISADARIISAVDLEVNEATLTGESLAVVKDPEVLRTGNPVLGDQRNMVFSGTAVVNGRAQAVVTATGMRTEIGKIAGLIVAAEDETTPLQVRLEQLGRLLVVLCLGICAAVGTLGILRGEPPRQMFLAAVSLAVAAIPEGLPAIVTIALAIGVQKMIRRQAIIRKLPAVETLGCATVICSDKTGTLTRNQLTVTRLQTAQTEYRSGELGSGMAAGSPELQRLLEIAALCNNATGEMQQPTKGIGDPTELALIAVVERCGVNRGQLQLHQMRLKELPFSAERKRMSVWVSGPVGNATARLLTKGAPDLIMERCSRVLTVNGIVAFDSDLRNHFQQVVERWGTAALRVLAFAYRDDSAAVVNRMGGDPEQDLILVGLAGMSDPPRPEVSGAIARARRAGILTKMITGDYPRTAAAIAKEIGLLRPKGRIITGVELDRLSDQQLRRNIQEIDVFARVAPQHKLRVVKALKSQGEIVAMTGDGVNDAPAVKEADIGVAMGLGGTDVTKEAASLILADDNYATIVAAVEEGRVIYDNIRKFIRYLLTCNSGEILTMFGGLLLGLPVPLLPIQILWVNLVTDGLPAIALGLEPAAPGLMHRPPRPSREGIFAQGLGWKIFGQGFVIGAITLAVYLIKLTDGGNLPLARTAAFTTLVMAQLCFVFRCRREEYRPDVSRCRLASNPYLYGAVFISALMQLIAVNLGWFRKIFATLVLTVNDWLLILGIVFVGIYGSEFLAGLKYAGEKHIAIFRVNTHKTGNLGGK
jgi:Ca2+-transporting ATPase